jgi:hypothetical protein
MTQVLMQFPKRHRNAMPNIRVSRQVLLSIILSLLPKHQVDIVYGSVMSLTLDAVPPTAMRVCK